MLDRGTIVSHFFWYSGPWEMQEKCMHRVKRNISCICLQYYLANANILVPGPPPFLIMLNAIQHNFLHLSRCPLPVLWSAIATDHMWLLSTWKATRVTVEMNLSLQWHMASGYQGRQEGWREKHGYMALSVVSTACGQGLRNTHKEITKSLSLLAALSSQQKFLSSPSNIH